MYPLSRTTGEEGVFDLLTRLLDHETMVALTSQKQ